MRDRSLSFVEDGYDRWECGVKEAIRAEVVTAFAERLREATWLRRLGVRIEIEREVSRRFNGVKRPSPEALF